MCFPPARRRWTTRLPSATLAVFVFCACGTGRPDDDGFDVGKAQASNDSRVPDRLSEVHTVTLRLDQREGLGALGWSLDQQALVDAEQSHLRIRSFDCGARGRWVSVEGDHGVGLCPAGPHTEAHRDGAADCSPMVSIEMGGSDPDVDIGDAFWVMRAGEAVAILVLLDRTETPDDWYEQPVVPFEFLFHLKPTNQ